MSHESSAISRQPSDISHKPSGCSLTYKPEGHHGAVDASTTEGIPPEQGWDGGQGGPRDDRLITTLRSK